MDELENLAKRSEAFERQASEANKWDEETPQDEPGWVKALPDIDAAGNRAEALLRIGEAAAKMIFDQRLMLPDEEIADGRASLGPVIQKYNLAGEGTGRLPYQEEITAGFYLGGLIKRFKRALSALRARDKAEEQAKRDGQGQANNGEKREHQPQESTQPVSSQVGVREVANVKAEGWLG